MDRTAHRAKQVAQAPPKLTCSLFHLTAISEPCPSPSPFPKAQFLFSKSSRDPDFINFIVVQVHSNTQSHHSRQADNLVTPALKQSARGAQWKHFARIAHLPLTGRPSAPFGDLTRTAECAQRDGRSLGRADMMHFPPNVAVVFFICHI